MNIQLAACEEYFDGERAGELGDVIIRYLQCHLLSEPSRCNNVMFVKGA